MSDYPVFKLNAVKKSLVASNSLVINADEFEYYLWVRVPDDIFKYYRLVDIFETGTKVEHVCMLKSCKYEQGPWYRIESSYLNRHPGYHIYMMKMVNIFTNDVVSIFFSYTIQDDSPEKPYKYMDESDACACACEGTT